MRLNYEPRSISFTFNSRQAEHLCFRPTGNGFFTPNSHDLEYIEGKYHYIDTYLGGFHFIGEEAVWQNGIPIWGMNYYGKMLVEEIPSGFGEFLKAALLQVPQSAPYRGPAEYVDVEYTYHCVWQSKLEQFDGWEEICFHDESIYRLLFHGGEIRTE